MEKDNRDTFTNVRNQTLAELLLFYTFSVTDIYQHEKGNNCTGFSGKLRSNDFDFRQILEKDVITKVCL